MKLKERLKKMLGPGRRPEATPDLYLGFDQIEELGSPESVRLGAPVRFTSVRAPAPDVFYFEGLWETAEEYAVPREAGARLVCRGRGRGVTLEAEGPGRVEVKLDGREPDAALRGQDLAAGGVCGLTENGAYSLLRREVGLDGLLTLTFPDPGVKLYILSFA